MEQISIRKLLQTLHYIQKRSDNNCDRYSYMYLLKMLYFSDRHHMRHYGFTISSDEYRAMKLGPVAIGTFDVLKKQMPKYANSAEFELLCDSVIGVDEYSVIIKPLGEDELSKSNEDSLQFSLNNFGHFNQFELSGISHDYPEWKKYQSKIKEALSVGKKTSFPISTCDFFDNPDTIPHLNKLGIKEDPFKEDDEFLRLMRDSVCETIL